MNEQVKSNRQSLMKLKPEEADHICCICYCNIESENVAKINCC